MKEEAVFSHLDVHNKPEPASKKHSETARSIFPLHGSAIVLISPSRPNSFNIASSARQPPKAMDRLPQLNYSLLKDNALRKKLSELGIPNGGPRALVIRRHIEWVNLVNANCDSRKPRSKRELLHELDVWDKTQGRQILNGSGSVGVASSVMNKDFDGAAWAASHDNDFQALIARARKNPKPRTEVGNTSDEAVTPMPDDHEEHGRPSYASGTAPESKTGQHHPPQDADKDSVLSSDPHRPMQASFVNLEAEA